MKRKKTPNNFLRRKNRKYFSRRYCQEMWPSVQVRYQWCFIKFKPSFTSKQGNEKRGGSSPLSHPTNCSTEWCWHWVTRLGLGVQLSSSTSLLDLPGLFSGSKASWQAKPLANAINHLRLQNHMARCKLYSGNDSWPVISPKPSPAVLGRLLAVIVQQHHRKHFNSVNNYISLSRNIPWHCLMY